MKVIFKLQNQKLVEGSQIIYLNIKILSGAIMQICMIH